jgi:CheY-like chemotaxis protein
VRLFESHRPEIAAVLLDLVMPVMGGDEALRALRQIDRGVPVILSSGYSAKTVRARCGLERPNGFLQKPYRDRELLDVLRQAF